MNVQLQHLTDAEYFAIPNRYHSSFTAALLTSPAAFHAAVRKETDNLDLGRYVHAIMSGTDALYSTGADLSQCKTGDGKATTSLNAKSVQDTIARWKAENPDAVVMSAGDLADGKKMAASLKKWEAQEGWTEALHREVCILWDDNKSRQCILKADAIFVCDGVLYVVDYKTNGKGLTAQNLRTSTGTYRYDCQAAHYCDGVAAAQKAGLLPDLPVEYCVLWVSSLPPFDAWRQTAGAGLLAGAAVDLDKAKARWFKGVADGVWQTAGELGLLPATMELPGWMSRGGSGSDLDYTDALGALENV